MKKVFLGIILLLAFAGCEENITDDEINDEQSNNYVLFYGFHYDSLDFSSVFVMDMINDSIKKVSSNHYIYPAWYSYHKKIIAFNRINHSIEMLDVKNPNDTTVLVRDIGNVLFIRYSSTHDAILFSYKEWDGWLNKIAYLDFKSGNVVHFPIINNVDTRNPIWSETDDFIYFFTNLGSTYNIMKVSMDGTSLEVVFEDNEFVITGIDISKDSKFLVASRYNQYKSYITVYDLETRNISYNIDVTNLRFGLYPSFTADRKKILFVNGIPYDYSMPRNIYIMDINGDNLKQLTFADDYLYFRPLNW